MMPRPTEMAKAPTVMPALGQQYNTQCLLTDDQRAHVAHADAQNTADAADHTGLNEELDNNALPLRADGLADADLTGTLGDGDQHDVHDADAAHQQGDGRNAAQQHLLALVGLFGGVDVVVRRIDIVVAVAVSSFGVTDQALQKALQTGGSLLSGGGIFCFDNKVRVAGGDIAEPATWKARVVV